MQMHNQNHHTSTCDQCGKTFNRKDNLVKHEQHCTGHRSQQQQQQQQQQRRTAPPPPPTFTISHRYTSMGGAVKRFNIDMQEKQYIDHLSPTLQLLLPTMRTFQTKHHAQQFQVAITIVFHKAMGPCVTQPPVTQTAEMIVVYADATPPLDDVNRQLLNFIEVFELKGLGWVFSHFQYLQLTLWQLDPSRGSAYLPLPQCILTGRAVVNVARTCDDCFRWTIMAGMHL